MSEHDDGRHARPHGDDRAAWWAGLTDDALEDETETNRRAERRLLITGPAVLLLTVVLAWWHGAPTP
ncbi:hypothetical protein ATJ88_1629 [Isoptericola jiangsuensis]|uniref:Uncharacterized protein n=1 Tax=Isoptericola jiangsuensis TaxID=548579 RepID=A0A2A9EXB4_9MICO|nr:hypothetical protein [Isoptericola jiangsuensis]PFG42952.1 hypothetical protein ATJ88_1629 [Isoptericola jiangsuensis]